MNFNSDLQIWIPAQGASQRIPDKNFRPFHEGESLLEIAIRKLLKVTLGSNLFVSSESPLAAAICEDLGVNFIKRDGVLLGNKIKQKDLFDHFIDNTPESKYVGWIQVTDPLFFEYSEFFSYQPIPDEVYVVATEIKKHAFFRGYPVNFNFGDWHPVTQDIEPIIVPRWSAFFAQRATFCRFKYHFGKYNNFYIANDEFVDIDYEGDFQLAQRLYQLSIEKGL